MDYPTIEDVGAADRIQLCRWHRFLPSPGAAAIGKPDHSDIMMAEGRIMDSICERHAELGGFTPEISKLIGW